MHKLLGAILDAGASMDALTDEQHGHPHYLALDGRDRSLVRAVLLTALRYHCDLEAIVDGFTDKPLPQGAAAVRHILNAGLAQIVLLDVPDHSAVDLAVAAAQRDPRARRFDKLVNALLRRAVREKAALRERIAANPVYGPGWFHERLAATYGKQAAEAILDRHRIEAPIDLTLRRSEQGNAARWAERLNAILLPTGSLRLRDRSQEISSLPGFAEGAWWVQDVSAAIPARLFGDLAGKRAIDLCAAPGGKTAQLVDAGAEVTALDLSRSRLKRLASNLTRLGLEAGCHAVRSDMMVYADERPFDAVLLDAPCSSTGTVRRHPDVPFTKSMADVETLARLQEEMLNKAADLVAPGGVLVFSNCSLDPLEGEEVAARFANEREDFEVLPVQSPELPGLERAGTGAGYVRLTPDMLDIEPAEMGGADGFFAVRFKRIHPPSL